MHDEGIIKLLKEATEVAVDSLGGAKVAAYAAERHYSNVYQWQDKKQKDNFANLYSALKLDLKNLSNGNRPAIYEAYKAIIESINRPQEESIPPEFQVLKIVEAIGGLANSISQKKLSDDQVRNAIEVVRDVRMSLDSFENGLLGLRGGQ